MCWPFSLLSRPSSPSFSFFCVAVTTAICRPLLLPSLALPARFFFLPSHFPSASILPSRLSCSLLPSPLFISCLFLFFLFLVDVAVCACAVSTCISLSPSGSPLYPPNWNPPFRNTQVCLFFPTFLCLPPPPARFCSWAALSPENAMTHITPAAAGFQMSSRFTKYPTQNPGDSILNSLESLLSKMLSNSPPPHTQYHTCYHLHTISTSVYHPCCCRSQISSPYHQISHRKLR